MKFIKSNISIKESFDFVKTKINRHFELIDPANALAKSDEKLGYLDSHELLKLKINLHFQLRFEWCAYFDNYKSYFALTRKRKNNTIKLSDDLLLKSNSKDQPQYLNMDGVHVKNDNEFISEIVLTDKNFLVFKEKLMLKKSEWYPYIEENINNYYACVKHFKSIDPAFIDQCHVYISKAQLILETISLFIH